jgi:dihydropteroate synthase
MPGVTRGVLDMGVSEVTAGSLEVEDSVRIRGVEAGALEIEDAVGTADFQEVRGQSGTSGAQLISVEVEVT